MTTNTKSGPQSDLPIPPGELLAEELTTIGMTRRQLALQTGCSVRNINLIIAGQAPITEEFAGQLEQALGVSAQLWLKLEAQYQSAKAHQIETGRRSG